MIVEFQPELKSIYSTIRFKPDEFTPFLLDEVGFRKAIELGTPQAKAKGACINLLFDVRKRLFRVPASIDGLYKMISKS